MALVINNPEAFARYIERVVANSHMTYMEAILDFCEKRGLEPVSIAPFISDKIKRALARDARSLHLLKRSTSPFEELT